MRTVLEGGYKLEKVPEKVKSSEKEGSGKGRGRVARFPLHALPIGRGFFVPGADVKSVSPLLSYHGKKHNKSLHVKTMEREGKKGCFIYRTKSRREMVTAN
jgi:hypothetical protein